MSKLKLVPLMASMSVLGASFYNGPANAAISQDSSTQDLRQLVVQVTSQTRELQSEVTDLKSEVVELKHELKAERKKQGRAQTVSSSTRFVKRGRVAERHSESSYPGNAPKPTTGERPPPGPEH